MKLFGSGRDDKVLFQSMSEIVDPADSIEVGWR
jgi:hypothetical protein